MRSLGRATLLTFLAAATLHAATFIVPPDDVLVGASKAVVVATASSSFSRWASGGWIETVTEMTVADAIKGPLLNGETFEIVELGGTVGAVTFAVAGSPSHPAGETALLFLETNDRGEWTTKNMAVGKFSFRDSKLVRDRANLCGWDVDGTPHREALRDAVRFLDYVHAVAKGEHPEADYFVAAETLSNTKKATTLASAAASTYVMDSGGVPMRWPNFPTPQPFRYHGTQPGAPGGGLTAMQTGLSTWTNDASSNVVLQYAGTTTVSSGFKGSDGTNSVQFNDPSGEIPGSYSPTSGATLAIGGVYAIGNHTYGGEQFLTVVEADLVVQDGIYGPGLTGNGFLHVVAHELGHCIALRHSDDPPPGGTSSTDALMNSSVYFDNDPTGAALQAWDREALAAVYGSGSTPGCSPPAINTQPKSTDVTAGAEATLSVGATGTAPLQYDWYKGSKGNTSAPVASGNYPSISVRPTVTTTYWVRVSNACPPVADSDAAVVTVNGCPAVVITTQPANATVMRGANVTLSVNAAGGTVSYQWYLGDTGDRSVPLASARSATFALLPVSSARYWVEATNSCGASAQSNTAYVTVDQCAPPVVVVQPSGGEAASGDQFTMSLVALGTAPLQVAWFEGEPGDTSTPVAGATSANVSVWPILTPKRYWARVTNACGEARSVAIDVSVSASCKAPTITQQPQSVSVPPGSPALLRVGATGTSLVYRWYAGQMFDFTQPAGGSSPTLYTGSVITQGQYWVRVSNECGSAISSVAKVTPAPARRRAGR